MKKQLHRIFTLSVFFSLLYLTPFTITAQTWTQIGNTVLGPVINFNEGAFGGRVSMPDAQTFASAAHMGDGMVLVYTLQGSTWVVKGDTIKNPLPGPGISEFGHSVSMPDGNTVAIGASYADSAGIVAKPTGSVTVFSWNGSAWVQKGNAIFGTELYQRAGRSVSMPDANTVALGQVIFYEDGSLATDGNVRIFTWNGSAWVQKGSTLLAEAAEDAFGLSISMPDANTIAAGAPGSGLNNGHVRVFSWNGSAWVQKGADIDGATVSPEQSGYTVSMPDVNTVAIGAPKNNTGGVGSGMVRVYNWNGSAWVQKGANIPSPASGDQFGYSVSMPDANTLGVGAPDYSFGNGRVYAYGWNGSSWVARGFDPTFTTGMIGISVSMPTSNIIAAGAPLDNNQQGYVQVFDIGSFNSIAENSFGTELALYPNPTQNKLTIALGDEYETVELSIKNMLGQTVSEQSYLHTSEIVTDLSGEPGIYFVQLKSSNGKTATLRVLKQ